MTPPNRINLITASADVGSVFPGKSRAPSALQSIGLINKLTTLGYEISIHDALPNEPVNWTESHIGPNAAYNEAVVVAVCQAVKSNVTSALACSPANTHVPFHLILGSECLICPAIMSALTHHMPMKRIGLLYVDVDCDLTYPNEPGSISNVVPFGLNSSSPANKRDHLGYLFNENYRVITSSAIDLDAAGRAAEALRWLEERVDCILVHLGVDVIDPNCFLWEMCLAGRR
ncbi:hypothetical protein BKA65DRAFT_171319 [Rhexocercosporidium sp. MPI-PUGE-AT-0058]|nr:hypothetical protein BKA65DRAFT_171319 [Rhexocercosporidium sp. MPI-PUGE-AT-0058]